MLEPVEVFIADIERQTNLSSLKEEHGLLLSKHLIDRLEKIDTLCEKFRKSIVIVHTEPLEDGDDDPDQEYLIQIRDKNPSKEIRHLARCLLRLMYDVRYPNEKA